jgi:hypothetical protein
MLYYGTSEEHLGDCGPADIEGVTATGQLTRLSPNEVLVALALVGASQSTMSGHCPLSEAATFHITVLVHIEELSHIESCAFYCCFLSNQSQFFVMFKSFVQNGFQNAVHFHCKRISN